MSMRTYKVSAGRAGRSLVDFLAAMLGTSKKRAKGLLDARVVFVNGQRIWMARHPVARGDVVEVMEPEPGGERKEIRILHEDAEYLVVDKPPGLLSTGEGSIETLLQRTRGNPLLRSGHRLDRETSGCLIMARSPAAFDALVEVFRAHNVRKHYQAIVAGRLKTDGEIIRTSSGNRIWLTRIRTLDCNKQASHLAVTIETGKTHQIRRHLSHVEHPVLGDKRYGTRNSLDELRMQIPRQMLHAHVVEFTHPATRQPVRVTAPLPHDFRAVLKAYRLT